MPLVLVGTDLTKLYLFISSVVGHLLWLDTDDYRAPTQTLAASASGVMWGCKLANSAEYRSTEAAIITSKHCID